MALRLTICLCLIVSVVSAADRKSQRPIAAAAYLKGVIARTFAAAISGLGASPSTITFNAPDPDTTPTASGNTAATVTWTMNGGNNTWSLAVNATSSSLTNCPLVPVSAITYQCN